jgi:putative Ca2+/H+ antiporter (TMEM165/GDT1 family)
MSTTFWAVFFGTALGLTTSSLIVSYVEEYLAKKRHQRLHDLLDHLEDAEFEDIED